MNPLARIHRVSRSAKQDKKTTVLPEFANRSTKSAPKEISNGRNG
jgi:hypothetical protein